MKRLPTLVVCMLLPLAVSCSSIVLNPLGSVGELYLADDRMLQGELISVDTAKVIFLSDSLRRFSTNEIARIRIDKNHNYGWIPHVLILNAVNAAFLAHYLSMAFYGETTPMGAGLVIAGVLLGVEFMSFLVSEPQEHFEFPLTEGDLYQLQVEARYSHPPTEAQLKILEEHYGVR